MEAHKRLVQQMDERTGEERGGQDDAGRSSSSIESESTGDQDEDSEWDDRAHDASAKCEGDELDRAIALSLSQPTEGKGKRPMDGPDASPSTRRTSKRKAKRRKTRRYKSSVPLTEDLMQHTFSTLTEGKGYFDPLDVQRLALELGVSLETDVAWDMVSLCSPNASEQVEWSTFRSFLAHLYGMDAPPPP